MVKSPIEYFESQTFDARASKTDQFSATERLFMQKYLGVDASSDTSASSDLLDSLPLVEGDPDVVPKTLDEDISLEKKLRDEAQVQLVGFNMDEQLFTIPTMMVQEVIRTMPPSRLPMTSAFVSGIINLRGRVTPLIRLRDLLGCSVPHAGGADRFTIICRCRGLQLGVQIDSVRNMYRIDQEDIQWNVEVELGINGECVAGLFKLDEKLVPIISVERIVETMLQE